MAKPVPPGDPSPLQERASVLQVTVEPGPRGSIGKGMARIRRRPHRGVLIGLAGAVALAAAVAGMVSGIGGGTPAARLSTAGHPGAAPIFGPGPDDPIEAIYRAPFRCLRVVVAAGDPAYARAEVDRAGSCWRDAAWATTILHDVSGVWRPLMVEDSGFCSARSLPAVVRTELGACPPTGSGRRRPG